MIVKAVVEVVHDIAASGPVCHETTQLGAVMKGVPKVTTHEVDALLPAVITPEKSVPVMSGEPPVAQPVRTGSSFPAVGERICAGK